jgi:UDP-N-acetyl-D-mannosaminuronic acid dehydrogenase
MPKFVLERVHDIMEEKGMSDLAKVGLYGLTYKENVDDIRESPTLQLIEVMGRHLAAPLKTYDPYIKRDVVRNQYHDFDEFLKDVDFVVIMVSHDEIRENMCKLNGKVILDTKNICNIKDAYKL